MGTLVICMPPSSSTYLYMSLWQSENAKKNEINKTKKKKLTYEISRLLRNVHEFLLSLFFQTIDLGLI